MRPISKSPSSSRSPSPTRSKSTSDLPTASTSTPKAADAARTRAPKAAPPDKNPFVARDDLADLTREYTASLRSQRPDATGTPAGFNAFLKEKGMRINVKDEGQVKMLLASNNRPAQYLQDVKARRQDSMDARRKPAVDTSAPQTSTSVAAQTANPHAIKEISEAEIQQLPNRVLQDFARLGYGNSAQFLAKSPTAVSRLNETSNANVRVAEGFSDGRSMTSRSRSNNQVTVYMNPMLKNGNHQEAAGTFLFEMNNAHRWSRFEELNTTAKNKVGTAPEYAQKRMEVEVEGMLHTGKSGKELIQGGHSTLADMKGWYVTDYLDYDKKVKALDPNLGKEERQAAVSSLRSDLARERLDVRHGNTSHREVYENQFNTAR